MTIKKVCIRPEGFAPVNGCRPFFVRDAVLIAFCPGIERKREKIK